MSLIVKYIELRDTEILELENLFKKITAKFSAAIPINNFLNEAFVWASELPFKLKKEIYDFKMSEINNCLVLKNLSLDFCDSIKTPEKYTNRSNRIFFTKDEIFLVLFSSLLGEVFTWDSIQDGNIINDIIPLKENESKPLSSGYKNAFDLHTEDAFHPQSGEYLGLLCLRNPTNTATTISSFDAKELPPEVTNKLFESSFIIGENLAHSVSEVKFYSSILFGDRKNPYIRINLNKIACKDEASYEALEYLKKVLTHNIQQVILAEGDLIFIDNLKTVHGREEYNPKFDGFDRWLKRVYITDNLKSSRHLRANAYSRIIEIKNKN